MAAVGGVLGWHASTLDASNAGSGDWYHVDLVWWAYHLMLICTLVAGALIELDGEVPPLRLIAVPLIAGLAMLWIWPSLVPASALGNSGTRGAVDGMTAALLVGAAPWLAWYILAQPAGTTAATVALGQLALVGGLLGDAAAIWIGVASMGLFTLGQLLGRIWSTAARLGWAGPLAAMSFAWILAGHSRLRLDLMGPGHGIGALVGGIATTTALAAVLEFAPAPLGRAARPPRRP
jgi:hypothetical protein